MTLVYLPRHVDQLISEIRSEWATSNDPDMHRVADAFPIEVLEAAYLRKLSVVSAGMLPDRAINVRQKINVMRCVLHTWLRLPQLRLGQMLCGAFRPDSSEQDSLWGSFNITLEEATAGRLSDATDNLLARRLEEKYPPKK